MILIAAHSVAAQSSGVQVGVEGGASIATLTGSGGTGVESRTTGSFGVVLVLESAHSAFGFETGVAYVPKGATSASSGTRVSFETSYVEVPLLLRVGLPLQGSHILPTLAVGASVGFNTGCRISFSTPGGSGANDCNSRAALSTSAFSLRAVDLGITAGVGVDIPLSPALVLAPAVRYTRGVTTISNSANAPDAVNSAFQLGVGLRWRL
jgi:outer membrane protein with beta-barrel domain